MNGKKKETRDALRSRLFFHLLAAAFLLAFAPAPVSAADLVLEMGTSAAVTSDPFLLSEAAHLTGDPELVRKAGSVTLPVPRNGILTRDALLAAMTGHGIGGIRLKLIMPPEVAVFLDESLSAVIKRLSGWEWQVEAEPLGPVPPGIPVAPPSVAPGTGSVTLKYDDGSGTERSLAVRLSWSRPAVVAARPVERGKVLDRDDVTVQAVRVLRSTPLASSVEEVLGAVARRNLSAGEPVALNLLSSAPIIQRGDPVIISVRKAGFRIEVRGEALDAGCLGDTIRVRNLQSRKVIQAVATAPGRVEVQTE
ncbi:flagella basal body P-ring formation protein FlgA [Aminivibrio pyruvatiphilus]|uniref:Flagella basal body P-ring formation protein FlgA n=1 Tax=Aminivibrio pyruvatiphilus TaxID=1005740 RepID=A0A4R8M325_9BACT|nr:flagellar basal body P-ring formation chaperone FlgA [Aminivibrio pyruvatiphilus]TDY58368.1 flagella basal body P-ring formation protein FlgA [Aminivibrio pyruvatiphilus]